MYHIYYNLNEPRIINYLSAECVKFVRTTNAQKSAIAPRTSCEIRKTSLAEFSQEMKHLGSFPRSTKKNVKGNPVMRILNP